MNGICRLCQREADLRGSHVVPAFAFKWLKDTSATPYMRTSQESNTRVQDGLTMPWLCSECEQRLGVHEAQFASKIFHPTTQNGSQRIPYGEWLLKFCVSISWRALLLASEQGLLGELSEIQRAPAVEALQTWHSFLRDLVPHPGKFEQHLLVFDEISSYEGGPLPANINRYALRSIEMDIPSTKDFAFTFVKMGPFAILGFLYLAKPREWSGVKVHVRHGVVGPTRYVLPLSFYDYLMGRARKHGGITEHMSGRQRVVADKTTSTIIERDRERILGSHWMKAMRRDAEMFGDEAFKVGWPGQDDG
jgi:hypothetical protein